MQTSLPRCEKRESSSKPPSGTLFVTFLISAPVVDPHLDSVHIALNLVRAFAAQLDHNLLCVAFPRFFEDRLHNFCLVVFLDLVQWVSSAPHHTTKQSAGPPSLVSSKSKRSERHTAFPCAPRAWYGRISAPQPSQSSAQERGRSRAIRALCLLARLRRRSAQAHPEAGLRRRHSSATLRPSRNAALALSPASQC